MSFRNYYDSSYSRSRDTGRSTSVSSDRPTSVTAKYITPSYKSSSIPVLRNEHSSSRDKSPISSIANRYNSYSKNDKPSSKYEKKDYTKLTVPSTASKSRDVSPISTSSKYSISRTSRTSSPDRRALKSYKEKSRDTSPADRDKDIPSKTDKSTGYNSLSSYKLYPRTSSYSRPNSRSENKPDISINRTRTESKPEITVNRYAIANRLSSNYLRSPTPIKRSSLSPVNNLDSTKRDSEKSVSPTIIIEEPEKVSNGVNEESQNKSEEEVEDENETETILVVTRHTSPTPPGSSAYLRSRRAEMAKTVEKTITRLKKKPVRVDKEVQLDRLDDTARAGRFGSTVRASSTNWSYYTPSSTHYTGYAGRYSTQYSSLREPSISNYDRSSRSRSREPHPSENNISPNTNYTNYSENSDTNNVQEKAAPKQNNTEPPKDSMVTVYDEIKDCEPSEIVINVNLKLKKAKNSQESNSTELVSPEITITNSQLPPPAPKSEISTKIKKVKVRKSSTDSSDSSSKKKIVKKRSKSVSSTESDQGSDSNQSKQSSVSPPKVIQKDSSKSNLQNGISKSKHSKSRDSNSPDSIVTLSTQSSVSEEESGIKSKSNDISRTSADETSIPTDRSAKQGSPSNISKHEGEEAKSFLIRALAPVTNLFKKHQDSSENSRWPENSTSESTGKDVSNLTTESDRSLSKSKSNTNNIIASNDDNVVKLKGIRHIESGERAWWMDSDTDNKNGSNDNHVSSSDNNIPKKIRHIESGERAWWLESNSENQQSPKNSNDTPDYASRSKSKFVDDEKPWWLEDNSANIPEGIERLTPPRKTSSESDNSDKYNFFKVRHTESGDKKDWWLTSSENSSHKFESSSLSRSGSDQRGFPLKRIRHVESGERPWWLSSEKNIPEGIEKLPTPPPQQESDTSDSEEVQAYYPPSQIPPFPLHLPDDEPLGDRRSPEGLEAPGENEEYSGGRSSPYENDQHYRQRSSVQMPYQKNPGQYISRFVDIDDILGKSGQVFSPYMDSILSRRTGLTQYEDEHCEEIDPTQVRIHDSTPQRPVIKKLRCRSEIIDCTGDGLDDATLQVFKDGEYGPYLDLDSTLAEQEEDLDGLQESRKNALILRTQLPVQVHAMIEKLHNSQGKELRRHLLSLKQKFQTDKDLVHAFVANKGLDCLMDVANINDQNYIDYILRAFGQLILYVDGMHGVMRQQECVRWLYTLVGNKYRHVIKTTLELLIVYVDYAELNCLQFVDAVAYVDSATRHPPWYNVMRILQDVDASDTELLIYATTLINKCLNKIPVRDVYYDQVDALQDQGMDEIIKLYMSKQGTDLDLLRQLQIFEAVLLYEDGDESGTALQQLDDSIIKSIQKRSVNVNSSERRKSKKQQMKEKVSSPVISHSEPETKTNPRPTYLPSIKDNKENKELPTALRRRRDRFARLAHHIIQQNELLNNSNGLYNGLYGSPNSNYSSPNGTFASPNGTFASPNGTYSSPNGNFSSPNGNYSNHNGTFTSPNSTYSSLNGTFSTPNGTFSTPNGTFSSPNGTYSSPKNNYSSPNGNYSTPNGIYSSNDTLNESYTNGNYSPGSPNGNHNGINGHQEEVDCPYKSPKSSLADVLKNGTQRYTSGLKQRILNGTLGHTVTAVDALAAIRQKQLDGAVETKDERGIIINREHSIKDLAQRITSPISPTTEEKQLRVGDMAGIVSKAKKELAKSQSKEIVKSPTIEKVPKVLEIKVSENDLHWEELKKSCAHRPYHLCDLDFSELQGDADDDVVFPAANAGAIPPPPPPAFFSPFGAPPPFPIPATKPVIPVETKDQNDSDSSTLKKKKTVKLFWREIHENPTPIPIRSKIGGFIWDDLPEVPLDTAILEHLFETRTNDLVIKKLMEPKCNMILDTKRSNAINIALKKLPTPQTIKAAIMKMDTTVIGREGIEMLLTMLPTEEEKVIIQEAQYANPDLPLDRAEQFLLALASINELSSRLKLWVFKLDFENTEKEIAEPLMDLMQGIELLKANKTFKVILSTLRSVGNFLNGSPVKGFRLEYLSKVMVVKDTVHKHPLLYHICEIIISKFSDTTDFFSEVGPVIRASKVDFDELQASLASLETDCKASWDHMKRVAKHDGSQVFITKLNEFLTDAAQRIILLNEIQKKVMSRYKKLLLYLGVPLSDMGQTKPTAFLKVIAEFALEYRTTRERVLLQLEKRANHRERNKTRGKMIMNVNNYATKNGDHSADSALKELLNSDPKTVSLTDPRRKYKVNPKVKANGDVSPDDEIIESLVRSATSKRQNPVRERRRNRISDNKTFNRTLDGHQSWPGRENGPAPGSATAVQYR